MPNQLLCGYKYILYQIAVTLCNNNNNPKSVYSLD